MSTKKGWWIHYIRPRGAREGVNRKRDLFHMSFKDGAYFCYRAYVYVLCISRYSGFLWVVPTSTGIFLRGLKLCGESRT